MNKKEQNPSIFAFWGQHLLKYKNQNKFRVHWTVLGPKVFVRCCILSGLEENTFQADDGDQRKKWVRWEKPSGWI